MSPTAWGLLKNPFVVRRVERSRDAFSFKQFDGNPPKRWATLALDATFRAPVPHRFAVGGESSHYPHRTAVSYPSVAIARVQGEPRATRTTGDACP